MNFKSTAVAVLAGAALLIPQAAFANPPGNPGNGRPCGVGNQDKWFCGGGGVTEGSGSSDLEANFQATSFCALSADNLNITTSQTSANTASGQDTLDYVTSGDATLTLTDVEDGGADNQVGSNSGFTIGGDVDSDFSSRLGETSSGTTTQQEGTLQVTGDIQASTSVFASGTYRVVGTLTCTTD